MKVGFGVVLANTVVDPLTMMIHTVDANVTPSAVVVS